MISAELNELLIRVGPRTVDPKRVIRKTVVDELIETKDLGNVLVHSKGFNAEEVLQSALETPDE
jgi:hypothetical protein